MIFYDLHFPDIHGEEIPFSVFRGKVCLVVNIASRCGFTPQIQDLETLYSIYRNRGFEILAFPSNDFGNQEPLNNPAIQEFCEDQFGATFPVFSKSKVKGNLANPVFRFLSDKKMNGHLSSRPHWNFHKYLLDREGNVVDFFLPFTKPTAKRVKRKIEYLLR